MRKFPKQFGLVEEVVKKFDEHSYETQLLCNKIVEIPEGYEVVACLPHYDNPTGFGDGPKSIIIVESPKELPETLKIKYLSASFDPKTLIENYIDETKVTQKVNHLLYLLCGFDNEDNTFNVTWGDMVDYTWNLFRPNPFKS